MSIYKYPCLKEGWRVKFITTPVPTSPPAQVQPNPAQPKVSFACPVPKEECLKGKEIFNGPVFLGIGYSLPRGSKIVSVMPGSVFFTATEDQAQNISTHSKAVLSGMDFEQGYVVIYEFFAPEASGSAQTKTVERGQELGTVGFGTFPKNAPYDGINLILSVTNINLLLLTKFIGSC